MSQSSFVGSLHGAVVDKKTQTPIVGAIIVLQRTALGAVTDENGRFALNGVPVGDYAVRASLLGYLPVVKTDIIIRSNRTTEVEFALLETEITTDEVIVTAGLFAERTEQPGSMSTLSYEEIRRAPGSAGDISRVLMGFPSLAKVNDQSNSLIVRGGSPMENLFLVDGIEIPNINHFPTQGATGGPIGILNVDLIKDVSFSAGGFSAAYGEKLSSVLDISLRRGNSERYDTQLDVNFAGIGGVIEGPLFSNASFLVSVRRSYLDVLVKTVDIGTSIAPWYGDAQWKISYDLSSQHSLDLIGIVSDDHNTPDRATAIENAMVFYGNQDIIMSTSGVSWKTLWSRSLYSITTLSYTWSRFQEDFFETNAGIPLLSNRSTEGNARVASSAYWRISPEHSISFGVEGRQITSVYRNVYHAYTDALGNAVPLRSLHADLREWMTGAFVEYEIRPTNDVKFIIGMRADHFTYTSQMALSPRFSVNYILDPLTMVRGAVGIYRQHLPMVLLSQNELNRSLPIPRSVHYIAGIDRRITENTLLTMEVYRKEYANFPVDPGQPNLFIVDELFFRNGFYFGHDSFIGSGVAESQGVEVTVQKKLTEDLYGLVSGALFSSRYKGIDGRWIHRVFDNRYLFAVEGGFKPNNEWELSGRWILAGGVPYTPFDLDRSQQLQREVLDESRVNEERLPAYHSLNIRIDRRFHFERTNLVLYVSLWNAYNRSNIAGYYWNGNRNAPDVLYQWGLLPIFGVEFEM